MQTVYFIQHGIALTSAEDENRPLSNVGIDEVRSVADRLRNCGIEIIKVYHSGKLRAQQTAEVFAQTFKSGEVLELEGMGPNDEAHLLIDQLSEDKALYVGHLPNIQKVVSTLIAGNELAETIRFKNAAVACVEMDGQGAGLKWFITPDLC